MRKIEMTSEVHGFEERLEDKLKAEGFDMMGKVTFKDGVISMKLSEYWKKTIPIMHDYEFRFVDEYCLPNQPRLNDNELYLYARIRRLS